ncbi:Helicase SWR1 [Babesia microti strain RI]|uniref:Helicase SWR1 n=1 Tax=Babesia microti (strain RI) TaxID=1133968 RepID=A0A1R4ABJ0_BABMR|nr:Helicase SWR1 [Babesia microti strain RI]SJK86366.1 Helicase SWR1 [Babesia microti strain RI]|eukprot:XP_012648935.2 Helicase SWR1 [Babesia microti strain RI]
MQSDSSIQQSTSGRNMRKSAVNQRLFMKKLSNDSLSDDEYPDDRNDNNTSHNIGMDGTSDYHDTEYNVWPPIVEKHPEFCWSHQFLHGRSDWILNIPPMPPDLTYTQILARAKLPVYIDQKYFLTLGAVYNLPDDKSPIMKIDLQKLRQDLSSLHNQMGKVNISKLPEPHKTFHPDRISPNAGHWDDLCKEMKEFQDLVLDEHREKRRKYKIIINSCQKYVESKMFSVSTGVLDDKRASAVYKQVCTLMEVFWSKIERIAWESIKSELNSQLIEQKRKRLNKFVKDAMKFATTDRTSKTEGNRLSPTASATATEFQYENDSDKEFKTDSEEFTDADKQFQLQQEKDGEYDRDMSTDSESERKLELDILRDEAEMDINELIGKYRILDQSYKENGDDNPLDDRGKRSRSSVDSSNESYSESYTPLSEPQLNVSNGSACIKQEIREVDPDEFDINDKEFQEQRRIDEVLDRDMDTDSESERKNEIDMLHGEAEMDLNELIKRYKQMERSNSISDIDSEMQMTNSEGDNSVYESQESGNESEVSDEFKDKNENVKLQQQEDKELDSTMNIDSVNTYKTESDQLQDDDVININQLAEKCKVFKNGEKRSRSLLQSDTKNPYCDHIQNTVQKIEPKLNMDDNELIPVPHLLRATLRSYQHQGLTWLAKLHEKGTNGILADEMGLGKTLQTISLLAHLACHLGKWGPHLIIVPNSLLINWEMEFKKFCPGFKVLVYYGSASERAKKRVGWNKPYVFNVCIASYATVVQDAHILKRKNWQYMVLDEAQNIKNFESKRWSTLLTFNSEYRILLTGTPLQNSIQELWSLMHFILPDVFSSHSEFKEWFGDPITAAIEAEQIAGSVDSSGKPNELVTKLHCVLRPYLLRRLKKDVEKQMPSKYEHVIKCTLTRRQRTLYDEFMSCASTSDTLKTGSYHGVLNIMMQLRKICNHPDQLNPRLVESPLNVGSSCTVATDIPNMLHIYNESCGQLKNWSIDGHFGSSCIGNYTSLSNDINIIGNRVAGYTTFRQIKNNYDKLWCRFPSYSQIYVSEIYQDHNICRLSLDNYGIYCGAEKHGISSDCVNLSNNLYMNHDSMNFPCTINHSSDLLRDIDKLISFDSFLGENIINPQVPKFLQVSNPLVHFETYKNYLFRCNYNAVVDTDQFTIPYYSGSGGILKRQSIINKMARHLHFIKSLDNPLEFLHHSQSLILPPKSALHDDCGKFHVLGDLLEKLKKENHRCLLYTQFSKMLDILESWICTRGYIYVRLDGKTKVDQRQRIVTRFNEDPKIFLFISSTRAGGIGLNLTGADTVIFYDTDWNPAMDRQAMDRCHRIGQTKDVNVYRLVSEYTVEENIWRKQLIKRKLDDVVVDQGKFGGEIWFNNATTLKDMIVSHKIEGDDEELYGKRILHESETLPDAPTRALKLMAMVEEEDDKIVTSKKDDKDEFKEHFSADTFATIPALVTLCVKFLKRYNTPNLSHLVNEFRIKIDAEAAM